MRDAAFAELGDTNLADLRCRASRRGCHGRLRDRPGRRPPQGHRHLHRPLLPGQAGLPAGLADDLRRPDGTTPIRIPGNTQKATYTCYLPPPRSRARRARRVPASTATACSAARARSAPARAHHGRQEEHDLLRDRLVRVRHDRHRLGRRDARRRLQLPADVRPDAAGPAGVHVPRPAGHPPARLLLRPGVPPPDGAPVIDTTRLYYDGNSQGGIMGGALVAVSPDIERGALGVPGMNYSTLLQRSVDFESRPGQALPADRSQPDRRRASPTPARTIRRASWTSSGSPTRARCTRPTRGSRTASSCSA